MIGPVSYPGKFCCRAGMSKVQPGGHLQSIACNCITHLALQHMWLMQMQIFNFNLGNFVSNNFKHSGGVWGNKDNYRNMIFNKKDGQVPLGQGPATDLGRRAKLSCFLGYKQTSNGVKRWMDSVLVCSNASVTPVCYCKAKCQPKHTRITVSHLMTINYGHKVGLKQVRDPHLKKSVEWYSEQWFKHENTMPPGCPSFDRPTSCRIHFIFILA